MGTPKVMKMVDRYTARMKCRVCGHEHFGQIKPGGGLRRGGWQCMNGCKLPTKPSRAEAPSVPTKG